MRNPNFGRGAKERETNQTLDHMIDKCLSPVMVQNMAYKVFFLYKKMKEIGEELKQLRKKSGVDISEASHDLNITEIELECIEAGNAKAFKDIYELKDKVRAYAKYLGLNEERIADEFNDFLFEKTSKIDIDELKKKKEELKKEEKEQEEERVSSPYTRIKINKHEVAPVFLAIVVLLLIAVVVYVVLKNVRGEKSINRELTIMEGIYELTE